jgi:CBS domain containing-hemolysin-like protein
MIELVVVLFLGCVVLGVFLALSVVKLHNVNNRQGIATQIEESDEIEEEARKMLRSVFEFGDMITREVMVPRTDMITLDSTDTYGSALKLFIRSGFSRMPVLGENADEILGIAYFKDLVEEVFIRDSNKNKAITTILRKALFVPESKPVGDLFKMMQTERQHIALVVDEYGGIAGLVTLEDTLEEIVGELDDEHDNHSATQDVEIERDSGGAAVSCQLPARYLISDVEQLFDTQIEHGDVDTILGLLTEAIGKVAIKGSHAVIAGLWFEAISVAGRRKQVSRILVKRAEEVESAD